MLRALKVIARVEVFVALAPTPQLKAAFEPWAPNTDPTDVLECHVQDITTSAITCPK
jgi:hypothetical protein